MTTIVLATRNRHKADEIRAILGRQFEFLTLDDFPDAPETIEDATTFSGNATKKALELARWLSSIHHPSIIGRQSLVLADDSGLEVDILDGAPGVHSARFAANEKTSGNSLGADNKEKLLRLLKDVPPEKRTARFRCVIALTPLLHDETKSTSPVCFADESELQTQLFDGACEGKIISGQRGKNGFGYDPLFVPAGFEQTFGELDDATKNKLSHRGRALEKLKQVFQKQDLNNPPN